MPGKAISSPVITTMAMKKGIVPAKTSRDRALLPHGLDDVERHPHRRADQRDLAHQHDEDAEPDRVDPGGDDHREDHRHGAHQHRQRLEEDAEQQVEDRQRQDQHELRSSPSPATNDAQRRRHAEQAEHEVQVECDRTGSAGSSPSGWPSPRSSRAACGCSAGHTSPRSAGRRRRPAPRFPSPSPSRCRCCP